MLTENDIPSIIHLVIGKDDKPSTLYFDYFPDDQIDTIKYVPMKSVFELLKEARNILDGHNFHGFNGQIIRKIDNFLENNTK